MAYMPLVSKVARSFARRSNDPVEDIVQVGAIGLLKAVDLYLTGKSTSFKTYATYLITGEIRHYLRDKTSMIRAPREIKELSYRVHKITMELTQKFGSTPTDEQLAQALQMPQKKIEEVNDLERRTSTISIDQLTFEQDGSQTGTIVDKIADESQNIGQEISASGWGRSGFPAHSRSRWSGGRATALPSPPETNPGPPAGCGDVPTSQNHLGPIMGEVRAAH